MSVGKLRKKVSPAKAFKMAYINQKTPPGSKTTQKLGMELTRLKILHQINIFRKGKLISLESQIQAEKN